MAYEPSTQHTYESFAARQRQRMEDAKRDQQAIQGSVNEPTLLPAPAPNVIYLRDESGFGPADIPVALPVEEETYAGADCCGIEPLCLDVFEEARGG